MTIAGNDAEWKAEQVIAGNHRALQALRELLLWPTLFSKEANILGLRVNNYFSNLCICH